MPSPHITKEYDRNQYYHVYNRGVEKRTIFLDDQDYIVFLGLLKKYLSGQNDNKKNRHVFSQLGSEVNLLAYCLMPSHFHLLLYQSQKDAITKLMRRVCTGYVMYFNNRYSRVGGLFQGRYKASSINRDEYLHHISRYIHLNPRNYKTWPYSSWSNYSGEKNTKWLKTEPIMMLFAGNREKYRKFVSDYEDSKKELDALKWQLANGTELV